VITVGLTRIHPSNSPLTTCGRLQTSNKTLEVLPGESSIQLVEILHAYVLVLWLSIAGFRRFMIVKYLSRFDLKKELISLNLDELLNLTN
jgi:hypothetical protein